MRRREHTPPHAPAFATPVSERSRRFRDRLLGCLRRWLCFRRILLTVLGVTVLLTSYSWFAYYQAWRMALRKEGFVDEMPPSTIGNRIVIFAPHPDDEVLGCGGVIQQALAAGAQVNVVLMTNGDASELSLIFGEKDLLVSPKSMVELGEARQEETLRALSQLGLPSQHVFFLSYPNNGLTPLWQPEHWLSKNRYSSAYTHAAASPYRRSYTPRATYCGQQVLTDLTALLQRLRPDAIYLPHPKDVHPDHWATSCFVQYALATLLVRGEAWTRDTKLFSYLIHWPRFPAPSRTSVTTELLPPADLVTEQAQWLRLTLPEEMVRRKLSAIRQYASQVPNYDRFLLHFARANETFERLEPYTLPVGKPLRVSDRGGRRHHMGGAEIDDFEFSLTNQIHVRAEIVNGGRKLGKKSYLAVDVKGWDAQGEPVVTEVHFHHDGSGEATRIVGNRLSPDVCSTLQNTKGAVFGFALPSELQEKDGFFLSCWGSLKDKSVDSIIANPVQPISAN